MDTVLFALLMGKIKQAFSKEKLNEAVSSYLEENPISSGATAEQAAQIDKNVADIDELKSDLDYFIEREEAYIPFIKNIEFLLGYAWGASGSVTDKRYATNKMYLCFDSDIVIKNPFTDKYYISIGYFNSDYTYSNVRYDGVDELSIPANQNFRISIKFVDDREFTEEDLLTIKQDFSHSDNAIRKLKNGLLEKLDKPKQDGTKGQILCLDETGNPAWINQEDLNDILAFDTGPFSEIFSGATWSVGKAFNTSGLNSDARYFVSETLLDVKKGYRIKNPNTNLYLYAYAFYDSNGNITSHTINFENNQYLNITEDKKIRIAIKFVDNRSMTAEYMSEVLNEFLVLSSNDETKTLSCSFMGDSITEGVNTTKTYHSYLSEMCDIVSNNYGANGSCISTYILSEDKHYYCMCKRVETIDKNSDAVFIFGGTNDFNRGCPLGDFYETDENGNRTFSTDTNTFKGALSVMMQYLKANFATKEIIVMTPIHRGNFESQPTDMQKNIAGLYLEDYVNAIKEACEIFSISNVIDLYTLSGLNPNIKECADEYFHNSGTIDNLHPNEKGHLRIAKTIIKQLNW